MGHQILYCYVLKLLYLITQSYIPNQAATSIYEEVPAQACPWKFHNAVYTTIQYSITYTQGGTKRIHKITSRTTFRSSLCLNLLNRQLFTLRYLLYRVHWIKQPISKLPIMSFHEFFNQSGHFFEEKAITKKQTKTCSNWS